MFQGRLVPAVVASLALAMSCGCVSGDLSNLPRAQRSHVRQNAVHPDNGTQGSETGLPLFSGPDTMVGQSGGAYRNIHADGQWSGVAHNASVRAGVLHCPYLGLSGWDLRPDSGIQRRRVQRAFHIRTVCSDAECTVKRERSIAGQ